MKKSFLILLSLIALTLIGCGNQQNSPPLNTSTPDPCSSENLPDSIQEINDLMREFDDASQLASNLPVQQLPDVITNMQRIRREAEDVQAPACLNTLRTYQINHMNGMIQTLLAFAGGSDQETINKGLASAREEHDRYTLEIVRLLGITLAPMTATSTGFDIPKTPSILVTP